MGDKNVLKVILVLLWQVRNIKAQDNSDTCYGPGSIATTAILTIIVVLLTQFIAYTTWKRYWKNRQGKHVILNLDPEKGKSEFSYDNPGFKSEVNHSSNDASVFDKSKQLSPLDALKTEKQKTTDDFDLKKNEIITILLKSRDFTGLGFDIFGNIRDGIFVKDILQRGPAYESGKLNLGDRIKNVTINFEHIVYEDAMAILSYASPYEVILQIVHENNDENHTPTKASRIGHPLFFKSPSFADLLQIGKNDKKPIMESPKTPNETPTKNKTPPPTKPKGWPNKIKEKLVTHENETNKPQSIENKFQKIGVRVLPMELKGMRTEQISPKTAELSQNDNNINLEINLDKSMDEVDKSPKHEEIVTDSSIYRGGVNGSGIKRNKDGIPQEIPSFMLNAAVAARKNRKVVEIDITNTLKSPKKPKGKAPAPPDEKISKINQEGPKNLNINSWEKEEKVLEAADYVSDSDAEIEHNSIPKVIELDAIDVTIHQFEDSDEIQNRKTASTGDLTKMQNSVKNNTNSLERAQSLDITDSVLPKMLGNSEISEFISNKADGFDGLRAFQSNRLVKSTEWGNLEDAVLDLVDSDVEKQLEEEDSLSKTPVTSEERTVILPQDSSTTEDGSNLVVEEAKEVAFDPESLSKWLLMERQASRSDSYYEPSKIYSVGNTNVSDDMKVSRHSLNGLEKLNKVEVNLETSPENVKLTNNNKRNSYIYETKFLQSSDVEAETKGAAPAEKPTEVGTDPTSKLTYITEIQLLPVGNKTESSKTGNLDNNISSKLLVNQQIDPEKELHKIQEIAKLQLQKLPELRYSSSFESSDSNGVSQVSVVNTNQDSKVYAKTHCARSESNASLKSRIPVAMSKTPPTSPERRNSQNFDSDFHRDIQFVSLPMQRSLSSSTITIHQKSPKNVTIQKIDFENYGSKSRSASIGKR